MVKVKTYVLYILDSNFAYEEKRIEELQNELDKIIGYKKSGLNINSTPISKFSEYTVGVWALAPTESENKKIIDKIKHSLDTKDILYTERESYTIWDGEKCYIEFSHMCN